MELRLLSLLGKGETKIGLWLQCPQSSAELRGDHVSLDKPQHHDHGSEQSSLSQALFSLPLLGGG